MTNGIVFRGEKQNYKLRNVEITQSDSFDIPFDKTLFIENGVKIPVDLLPAAWHFLQRWDMACPLWRYNVTAQDVGTKDEQTITKEITKDLRIPLYSYELLFVKKNETTKAFMALWEEETRRGKEKRLAFVRAYYKIKPIMCVLPTSWLAEVKARVNKYGSHRLPRKVEDGRPMTTIELEPGRLVKCRVGDEEKVLEQFRRQRSNRRYHG